MTNVILGISSKFWTNQINFILELIASTVSRLLATRFTTSPLPYATTEEKYDHDYNIIETDEPGPYTTYTYYGDTCSIPAHIFERIFWLICTHSHQALLLWHQHIQGKISWRHHLKNFNIFISSFNVFMSNGRVNAPNYGFTQMDREGADFKFSMCKLLPRQAKHLGALYTIIVYGKHSSQFMQSNSSDLVHNLQFSQIFKLWTPIRGWRLQVQGRTLSGISPIQSTPTRPKTLTTYGSKIFANFIYNSTR